MNNASITTTTSLTVSPIIPKKRPRPVMRKIADPRDLLAWEPTPLPLYVDVEGKPVRAGESFAVTRAGWERWPLGIVSDHYKVTSHNTTRQQILSVASDRVQYRGAMMAGHGYHIAQMFEVRHLQSVGDATLSSRLVVTHDHTGLGALRAAMVVYVDNEPMGAVVNARAIHTGSQATMWSGEIDAMIEKAILAQGILAELFVGAKARKLDDTDREWLAATRGLVSKKGKDAKTLFEAARSYFDGNTTASKMTWGVWERRLDDKAIRIMCEMLDERFGRDLDSVLGGRRYAHRRVAAPTI